LAKVGNQLFWDPALLASQDEFAKNRLTMVALKALALMYFNFSKKE